MGVGLVIAALATTAQPKLSVFLALIGHCWAGEVAPGAIDTHCFASVYGGQHIRDEHRVEAGGKPVYSGETLYSVAGTEVVFTYWNSLGGVGTGTMATQEGYLVFTGAMRADPNKNPEPLSTRWRWIAPDRYEVTASGKPIVFRKVGRKAADQ